MCQNPQPPPKTEISGNKSQIQEIRKRVRHGKNRGQGARVLFRSLEEKMRQTSTLVCWKREVSSGTSRILILVMLPIIDRPLLFKLSWRMSVRDLMRSLTYHVPSNDCAHISLLRNESTGLRDDRECFSWWLRCCVGTAAPVAMYQALYHVRLLVDWLSLMKTADAKIWRTRSAFHLFQQLKLDKISNKKAIQESTPDTWIWFPLSGIHWLVIGPVWHWSNLPAPLSKGR